MTADDVVADLLASRKYGSLCSSALSRVAVDAVARSRTSREAAKAAKRKLHQVFGAYWVGRGMDRASGLLENFPCDPGESVGATKCREILACHASTTERLSIMEAMYRDLFGAVPMPPRRVVDLCCGLNPFSIPWMPLPPSFGYRAVDVDSRLVGILNGYLGRFAGECVAEVGDLVENPPEVEADLVLLLKSIPCLEQQREGAVMKVLSRIRASAVAVSFPTRSLGGRAKGMRENYEREWLPRFEAMGYAARRFAYPGETLYVLTRL